MRIYLIRHGRQCSTKCNVDVALDQVGIEQARIVGRRMVPYGIDAIYASSLIRARETAEYLKEELVKAGKFSPDQPIELRRDLREIDFGILTGTENKEVPVLFKDFMEERASLKTDIGFPEGECGRQVWERSYPILQEMIASGKKRVAVVTHGGVIRSLLTGLLEMDQANKLLFCKHLENCSITELYYKEEDKRFYVERVNDYAHIEGSPNLLRKNWT